MNLILRKKYSFVRIVMIFKVLIDFSLCFGGLNKKNVYLAINCGSNEDLTSGDGYTFVKVDLNI